MTTIGGFIFPDVEFKSVEMDVAIQAALLLMARIRAFFLLSPFLGSRSMPRLVRFGLVSALVIFSMPATYSYLILNQPNAFEYMGSLGRELIVGLFLGVIVWLPVRGLELVGVLLDTQRGATTGEDFDIIFNAQTTPTAILLAQIFSGYFFASGGFLIVSWILMDSLTIWLPGGPFITLDNDRTILFLRMAATLFFSAVVISLPVVGFMFMGDFAVALIARVAPTLNALAFAMPVKSAIMITMLSFYVELAMPRVIEGLSSALDAMRSVFENG